MVISHHFLAGEYAPPLLPNAVAVNESDTQPTGAVSGCAAALVLQPLDLIKTRVQQGDISPGQNKPRWVSERNNETRPGTPI